MFLLVVFYVCRLPVLLAKLPEIKSKEKHGVWDPMPELTINSPYVDSNTFTMGNILNPKPEWTLSPSPDLGFGLCGIYLSLSTLGCQLRIAVAIASIPDCAIGCRMQL